MYVESNIRKRTDENFSVNLDTVVSTLGKLSAAVPLRHRHRTQDMAEHLLLLL